MPGGISYIGDFVVIEEGGEITSQSVGNKALKSTCADAVTIEVDSTTGQLQLMDQGTSLSNGVKRTQMSKYAGVWIRGSLTASDAASGIFQAENTFGSSLLVTRVVLLVTTAATGSCKIDVGFDSASVSDNDIIDDLQIGTDGGTAYTGAWDNVENAGSAGSAIGLWESGDFINASMASGATSGLVGSYAIHVVDITS